MATTAHRLSEKLRQNLLKFTQISATISNQYEEELKTW